ncbi:MAG TPA: cytochrome c1 [Roseiarcus sp.]|nr:cytochrome c1 [Roseiarcus sp.]
MTRFRKIALASAAAATFAALAGATLVRAADEQPAATPAPAAPAQPAAAAPAQPAAAPAQTAPGTSAGDEKQASSTPPTEAGEGQPSPTRQSWSFSGLFGTFDQQQLQRGFKVYHDVCANCHTLSIPFRTLSDPDGPGFSEAQVKALAATYTVTETEPNDKGEYTKRPGRPSDLIPGPYPNPEAAAAALGKEPPDMSTLVKARKYELGFPWFVFAALPFDQYQEVGADYVFAILNGYTKPDDLNWNLYFPGHQIAMPKPLSDGQVEYTDGTPATTPQYSRDVVSFLYWASEPTLAERKKTGLRVMVFLIVLSVLLYFTKKRVWEKVH